MFKIAISIILVSSATLLHAQQSSSTDDYYDELFAAMNDTVKKKRGQILNEVIINGSHEKPASAVRSGIKPMDLPQSLQIISSEIIGQQQSLRLSDVVKNANGVYVATARGGAQESLSSRGYDMAANNTFKNGFRFSSGSMPDVASLEKVEILKGSAALLYGNVTPGGILNMVTKSPLFENGGEVSMQYGSYNFYKPSVDFYGPLSKNVAYRFVGSYENSESFRDVVKNERFYVNPSLLFNVSPKTEILLQADYLNADWTPDFGTGIIEKEILDLPRDLYLGARWSHGNTVQSSVSAMISHEFNKRWKLDFNSSFQDYQRTSKGTERVQPLANGDWNRPLGQNKNKEQILGEQLSLQGIFHTGKVKHQLFTGVDFENSFVQAYTFTFENPVYGTGNVFDFENFDQGGAIPNADNTRIVKTGTNRFGVYAQDLISLTDKWKVLAGIRWSWQEAQADTHNIDPETGIVTLAEGPKKHDKAFTPKAGIIFQPVRSMTLFASYANSFTPNTGTTVDLKPIEASIIDQYEFGVKKEFWNGRLSTNVTLYQIVNSNLAQTAEFNAEGAPNIDTSLKVLSGETTSKGIEVDIMGSPVPGLDIMAGYSHNDMRYTDTAETNGSFIEGDRVVRIPANTANLSFFYTLQSGKLKGLSVGALGNYIGKRVAGWNNQLSVLEDGTTTIRDREIPMNDFTTIDLSAGYTWNKISLLVKVSNITNELNYTVHENYSVNPIPPTQFLANLKYTF